MKNTWLKKLSLSCALALTAVLTACGPQGVSKEQVDALMAARYAQATASEEAHVEASGFKFVNAGTDMYVYKDGEPVATLYLSEGQVYPIEVLFLDASGNVIDFSVHEPGEFNARVKSSNISTVRYESTDYFTGNLHASSVGTATMTVDLVHLDHPDYTASFNVEVGF